MKTYKWSSFGLVLSKKNFSNNNYGHNGQAKNRIDFGKAIHIWGLLLPFAPTAGLFTVPFE